MMSRTQNIGIYLWYYYVLIYDENRFSFTTDYENVYTWSEGHAVARQKNIGLEEVELYA